MSNTLRQQLLTEARFTPDEADRYLDLLSERRLGKKEHLLRAGEVSRHISYVTKGCLRRYLIDEHGKEVVVDFFLEDWWTGDLESFLHQRPSVYSVQALEPCTLLLLSHADFLKVCDDLPKFRAFHDEKARRNHFATLKRLSVAKSGTAEEKYLLLMEQQPALFQRVPMHTIAAYLGIEPESLSRLRKRLSRKHPA